MLNEQSNSKPQRTSVMFKFLFKLFSVTSFLSEKPKQNNIHFDVERREKMKKTISEINQYYKTLQQSYASRDGDCHHDSVQHHLNHDYSSYDCSDSSSEAGGSCDSGSD